MAEYEDLAQKYLMPNGPTYEPSNMDFAGQVQANRANNLLYNYQDQQAPVQAAAPTAISPTAVEEAMAQRRALMAELNKAMSAQTVPSGMSDSEKYFRLAAAFGKTGKTGHFSESLGNVNESLADIEAEQRKEQQARSGMNLQRLQARMGLADQQYQLAREGEMQDLLKRYLNKGQQVTDNVVAGATNKGPVDDIPDDIKSLILAQPTEKAIATIIEISKENNKPSDLIKGVKFLINNGSISSEKGSKIIEDNLQGKIEQVDVVIPELGGTFKLTSREARSYYDANELPSRLQSKATPAAPGAAPGTIPASTAKPISQEQVEANKTALQEQAKADIEEGKNLVAQKQFANDQIMASKRILGLAKTNPNAFGLTATPGLMNAVASIVDKGVTTPWGSFSIDIEEPLSKLKLKPEELQARRQAVQALTQIEVGYRKLFLKGEGAVSNMEGQLAKFLGPEIKDDPKTAQIKAGLIQIASEKQNAIIEGYQKYKATHPTAGPQAYYQTPDYNRVVDAYENKYSNYAKKAGVPIDNSISPAKKTNNNLLDSLKNDPRWNN
jgi:hypothetical protein